MFLCYLQWHGTHFEPVFWCSLFWVANLDYVHSPWSVGSTAESTAELISINHRTALLNTCSWLFNTIPSVCTIFSIAGHLCLLTVQNQCAQIQRWQQQSQSTSCVLDNADTICSSVAEGILYYSSWLSQWNINPVRHERMQSWLVQWWLYRRPAVCRTTSPSKAASRRGELLTYCSVSQASGWACVILHITAVCITAITACITK